uniref:Cytochrome b5 heme-binding domain-containing protein n=1 Tax=Helicotheca tamesis TaxID=374047 RepID=A0A7S2MRW4_9STRA
MQAYQREAQSGIDEWGKTSFRGVPKADLDNEIFYAGIITPVLHYCMGGVTIDVEGNVLDESGDIISGLHAAGEVAGGVHGNNRLGGNSLLECTVYGTIIGKKLPVKVRKSVSNDGAISSRAEKKSANKLREITPDELAKHNTEDDCWVSIHGNVYDLTDFAEEHPPGAQSIHDLAGQDGTEAFESVHNENILDDFTDVKMGILKQ